MLADPGRKSKSVDMTDLLDIGRVVKERRQSLRISQRTLAARAAVSVARIEALENGRVSEMGFKILRRILITVNLDISLIELHVRRPTLEELRKEESAQS